MVFAASDKNLSFIIPKIFLMKLVVILTIYFLEPYGGIHLAIEFNIMSFTIQVSP